MKQRNIHVILAAAIFGTIIWLSVSMREQYQIAVDIPLTIEGISDGSAIRSPVPRFVQVKLRSDGWKLATLMLGPELHLNLPLTSVVGERRAILVHEIAERFALLPGIQVVDCSPETLEVELDRASAKIVPVEADYQISFAEGYGEVGPTIVTPESVSVRGAETVLRSVDSWRTEHRTFADLRSSLDAEVQLLKNSPYLITVTPPSVRLRAAIEPFAEQTFAGLTVEIRSVPPDREVILVPPKVDIVVRGGIRQLASLSAADFRVSADYSMILSDTSGSIEPRVAGPRGVQIVRRQPDRLTYIIRKPS